MQQNKKTNIIERLIALFLLIFLLPFLVIISIVIIFQTGEHPVFVQKRGLSFHHPIFRIYKLRTLRKAAAGKPSGNILYKSGLKEYIFYPGNLLRRSGLDEVLQLINIIKGEMKFVGPRPLSLEDLSILQKNFPSYYDKRKTLDEIPGITGFWQVFGNRSEGIINLITCEQHYYKNKSLKLNTVILLKTLLIILKGMNSDAILCNGRIPVKPLEKDSYVITSTE